jgi:DNA-binding NarL/FixJ family response regulator
MKHYLAIIEDQISYRESLYDYLNEQPEFSCVLMADSIEDFLANLYRAPHLPTLILCDIGLPGVTGIEGLPQLLQQLPHAQVLMLSVYTDAQRVFAALCAGAVGYLVKSTPLPHLRDNLFQAAAGGSPISPSVARHIVRFFQPTSKLIKEPLTPREKEVLKNIEAGLSHKLIAERLFISLDTVRNHIRQIYRKLQVNSKGELLAKSLREGRPYL